MYKIVFNIPSHVTFSQQKIEAMLDPEKFEKVLFVNKPEQLEEVIEDTDVLVTYPCEASIIRKGKNLKWLQAITVGVDAFPIKELHEKGVIITNGKGVHRIHMAEYAIASMIMMARNIHSMIRNQMSSTWDRQIEQNEIFGATVGILGLGSIGQEIAKKASLMGMRVIGIKNNPEEIPYVDNTFGMTEIEALLKESDYVINLLPETVKTRKIINAKNLSVMKKNACLINMGRGGTIDEEALIKALKERWIRGFVADVFEEEPLPQSSPLWKLENVVITPHICGESTKYMEKLMPILQNNLKVFQGGNGNMMNVVDLEKGY
ncbi:D-2-hydroxyacid dehydrogenase [Tindallia californiensis]|uniref:Phosphoglycerate dehydrogenase n=1 Tax=Tindallia californiensis TaxID=159292 RepID=A0A1H3JUC8_9FIRM|nr:D-2-hydroxyacid dehydrogenase [Tindallia californiensis]SDY43552.1 Phosphoglycerate dehydrogenase [Tindallia californiensis]